MSFKNLELASPILKALDRCGYAVPTPIQARSIPKILAGQDVIASARTGTGKTAAFMLPILQHLSSPGRGQKRAPRALVLTPTRELAEQITQSARVYGQYLRVKSATIVGGMPYQKQIKALSRPLDLVIATPGRLLDLLGRGNIKLSGLEVLVLDEADRMLDMGFIKDVERIVDSAPPERQTLLFAATLDNTIVKLAQRILKNPERVETESTKITHKCIEQRVHVVDNRRHKHRMLEHLIADSDLTRAIIFSATKRDADHLARGLYAGGHAAAALHGDMRQSARNRTMSNMRRSAEDYVHRIGRTGRAGASGIAISFALPGEVNELSRIERYIGRTLRRHVIPGLEPTQSLRHAAVTKKRGRQPQQAQGKGRNGSKQPTFDNYGNTMPTGSSKGRKWTSRTREGHVTVGYRRSKASPRARWTR